MIKKKREGLEQFIIEQTLGPGVSGYRFVALQNEQLLIKDLLKEPRINYKSELINIVPAGVYSTGILFPRDKSKLSDSSLANLFERESNPVDGEDGKESEETSIEEDSILIDQMYPNSMGFTCCVGSGDADILKSVTVKVQARYYIKAVAEDQQEKSYGVLCECDPEQLRKFIADLQLSQVIVIQNIHENKVVTIARSKPDLIKDIRTSLRNALKNESDKIKEQLSEFEFTRKSIYASSLKQGCYYELRNNCVDDKQRQKLYRAINHLEQIENFISHIDDLLSINGDGYGLWKALVVEKEISLSSLNFSDLDRRKIYSHKDHEALRDIFVYQLGGAIASLSVNIQISKNSRKTDDKIFFKIQLVNTSTPFVKDPDDSRYYSTFNELVNQRSFFGVKLSISHTSLIPYNEIDLDRTKENYDEDDITKFIYRQFRDYAVGHGCSVKWKHENQHVTIETEYLPTCDTPEIEPIPRNKFKIVDSETGGFEPAPYFSDSKSLEFKWLSSFSDASDTRIIDALKGFINCYQIWIDAKRTLHGGATELEHSIAKQELDKCQVDKDRMINNIDQFLVGDPNRNNLRSFRMMNSAMFMQLWHSIKVKDDAVINCFANPDFVGFDSAFYESADDKLFDKVNGAAWRPFQLAFILLNLDGIFREEGNQKWEKRNEFVDLVWFPTGGGKTEAYLGIIALTIINRRISFKERGGGTAALMRYTLRLLTLQQFQRATLVIMGLELMRRWDSALLGEEPIFIGLWVGDNSLPNKLSPNDPDDKNTLLHEFQKLAEGQRSRVPYEYCPWCRSKLHPATQVESDHTKTFHFNRLHLRCSNPKCSFYFRSSRARKDQGPIPASLCDEEIYQHPPALLFGTVDKFAQLAHKVSNLSSKRNSDSRRIFGLGNWEHGKPVHGYLTPDLIIQDELHLLLGPLGSSVALFESAIDQLCTREDGTRPKVISSTATTRNTDLQIMALFDRKVNLFPKLGVDCDDSFFSFYKRSYQNEEGSQEQYHSKRRYIGVLPTGRTQIWMQMRLAAILMTHRALFEIEQLKEHSPLDFDNYQKFEKAMDYYHTVVSYFNSLKEVGKTESQIHTYVLKEIRRVFNRVIRPSKLSHALYTYSVRKGELTGRLSGEEVKNELDKVQSKWKARNRFARQSEDAVIPGSTPPDFVVATNMISVGIDVSRFNSILINSMPRNIAEYIQASSRVARESYGLVLTIHHPFRARDVSHYEKFIEFHEKMYSYVEPISITPFTQKAVDRYLGLYLATMIRHTTRFNNRNSAGTINGLTEHEVSSMINHLTSYFERRYERLQGAQVDKLVKNMLQEDNVQNIKNWIAEAINEWQILAEKVLNENKVLVFKDKRKANPPQEQLYVDIEEYEGNVHSEKWQVPMSLRVIEPEAVLKIKLK